MDGSEITNGITAAEAAKILGVTTGTLANWRSTGVGPAYSKTGDGPRGHVLYASADVRAYAKTMRKSARRVVR